MLDFPLWKRFWFWALTLVAAAAALPSLASVSGVPWPSWLPDQQVSLGLDLAGGSHILLEAERSQVVRQRLSGMEEDVQRVLRNAEPRIAFGDISTAGGRLSFLLEDPSRVDAAREAILPLTNGSGVVSEWNLQVVDNSRFILTPTKAGLDDALDNAMASARDVVQKRIDAIGTREPTVIREGDNRIVVQVPGLGDPSELKELIGRTAELEFKLVDSTALASDIEKGVAPAGSEIVPYAADSDFAGGSVAVKRLGGIRGNSLTKAAQGFDQQTNQAVVNITFDQQGGAKFCKLTQENVGKPFAMILDGKVLSAPNINEPICSGQAQISGNFTAKTAGQLAIALQSGALPVNLTVIQESTVGPDLGADSIRKGLIAMAIGSLLVVVLMIVTYGRFGIYATIALVLNVAMIVGIMAVIKSTLTLPGLAGLVLTIGAAVDANVLINERIREERKRGRRVFAAVENGYREASRAIWDANITNVIAAVVLAWIAGAGPVRGFAIVLIIGIITTIFTSVYLTRMWVAGWLRNARPNDLSL
jgi:preprotein translocase subunit SecD